MMLTEQNTIPQGWKETTLGEVAEVQNGYAFKSDEFSSAGIPIIKIKNIASGRITLDDLDYFEGSAVGLDHYFIKRNDILVSMTGSHITQLSSAVGKLAKYDLNEAALLNQRVGKIYPIKGKSDNSYLYYLLSQSTVQIFWGNKAGGSANQANISPNIIKSYNFLLPPLSEQKAIAAILSSFDDKIELLRRQNKTLEAIAQTIFKELFVKFTVNGKKLKVNSKTDLPDGWTHKGLDEIADFLNGLPLQKYLPENEDDILPVIKIRELKSGITEQTDKASKKIEPQYIIDNGDVLFSWSGSLDIVLWCCGKGALNQHLFKVTSKKYPKWFYYYWILEHLPFFKSIAEAKATTMGHIQRHHLAEALVAVPDNGFIAFADSKIKPIFEHIILNNSQIQTLSKLRDALLPKLMKGEIRVKT
jgi:type I restriction enzyme S subunit